MTTRTILILGLSLFIGTISIAASAFAPVGRFGEISPKLARVVSASVGGQQLPPKPAPDGLTTTRNWKDEDLDKIMKQVGPTAATLRKMIDARESLSAEAHADTLEHFFRDVEDFFDARGTLEAEQLAEEAIGHASRIEDAAEGKDFAKADEHLKRLMNTCQTCHSKFRDRDASGAYHLKKR
jgi:cytochrome c556